MGIVLRTGGTPLDFANIAREKVHAMDPTQPLSNIRPLEELVDRSTANRRFSMLLLAAIVPGKRATRVDPTIAMRWE